MKKNIDKQLRERLCPQFCSYYKPEKRDDVACGGFLVLRELMAQGIPVAFTQSARDEASFGTPLVERICLFCPFYEEDCDFISGEGTALPCGGFILLSTLMKEGSVDMNKIEAASRGALRR